jgi:hypothetical protein
LGGICTCDVLYDEPTYNSNVGQTSFSIPALTSGRSSKVTFRFGFNRETLYHIDKTKPIQSDVNLAFGLSSLLLLEGQGGGPSASVFQSMDVSTHRMSQSDWIRFTSPWSQQAILLPVSPQTMTKIEELAKARLGFRNIDEIVRGLRVW